MQPDTNVPVIALVNDLEALITEIDNNPQISSWVVRLILKSIKDKARKMATEFPLETASLDETDNLAACLNSSAVSTSKIRVLQRREII
jgi:hypothetical protein